jgi:hypothetical protein
MTATDVGGIVLVEQQQRHDLVTFPRETVCCAIHSISHEDILMTTTGGYGDNRIRTGDPLLAKQVLYQLSYVPLNDIGGGDTGGPGRT